MAAGIKRRSGKGTQRRPLPGRLVGGSTRAVNRAPTAEQLAGRTRGLPHVAAVQVQQLLEVGNALRGGAV